MAGTVKKLEFAEGTDVGAPTDLSLATSTTVISAFANDAAYVLSEGAAVEGSVYLNSTTEKFRMYVGGAWRNAVPESDSTDTTKVFLVDVSGNSTGVSATIKFVASGNRVYTFPNGAGDDDVVLRTLVQTLTNKELTQPVLDQAKIKGTAGVATLDVNTPGDDVTLFANADDITVGQASTELIIQGDVTVNGTLTSINTTNLEVVDKNITLNNGGNDVSAEGAGLTVERTSTNGSMVYQNSLASKWKAGALGSEVELANVSSAQTFTGKDYDGGTASNTSRMTLPKNTKSNLDALTRKEATIVYSTDLQKAYIDNGSTLTAIGSGTGSGEINYVINSDAETDATNTSVYADAAAATPVDGSGGSPTVTITRSTSSPLRGNASFLLTKPASNVQGQGYAWTLNAVDLPDRSKKLKFQFDYDFTATNFAYGDITLFVYDITNTTIITPQNNVVDKAAGTHVATWDATTSSSYRVIMHHATTSALGYTLKVDNVIVGPGFVAKSAAVSPVSLSLTINGLGTVSNTKYDAVRIGSDLVVTGTFAVGTVAASTASLQLPSGLTIDSSRLSANGSTQVGDWVRQYNSANNIYSGINGFLFYDKSTTDRVFFAYQTANTSNDFNKVNGNTIFVSSGEYCPFRFRIPIAEWAQSGTINVLQEDNLTKWTSYSLTIGATTTAPGTGTVAVNEARFRRVGDSMEIKYDFRKTAGGSNGSGTYLFPLPPGYTIDTTKQAVSTTFMERVVGTGYHYTTISESANTIGDVAVIAYNTTNLALAENTGTQAVWMGSVAGALGDNAVTGYSFTATVPILEWANSQNALVGFAGATSTDMGLVRLPSSRVYVHTGNGFGSTATRRRRFATVAVNTGTAITYADSAANGTTFTINRTGLYAITYSDKGSAQHGFAICRNTSGTSNPGAYTAFTQRLNKITIVAGLEGSLCWTGHLSQGDVVEAAADTANNDTSDEVLFSIVHLGDA